MSGRDRRFEEGEREAKIEKESMKDQSADERIQQEFDRMVLVLGEGEASAIFEKIKACPAVYLDANAPALKKLAKLLLANKKEGLASLSLKLKEIREVRSTEKERMVCEINWLIERLQYIVETLHSTEDPGFAYNQAGYYINNTTGLAFYDRYKANLLVHVDDNKTSTVQQIALQLSYFAYPTLKKYFPHLEAYMDKAAPNGTMFIGKNDGNLDTSLAAATRTTIAAPQGRASVPLEWTNSPLLSPALNSKGAGTVGVGAMGAGAMPDYELEQELHHMHAIRTFLLFANNSLLEYTVPHYNANKTQNIRGIDGFSMPAHLQKLTI
ncbi:hypothetical protein B484DRAFT_404223 [Ochromonadaceae sp. CCMP2298]|nr:hypothetical protein B484DRAFT_404223 [Ochromonadaceae sp. CCMP2298]|mmetsp:Transcript_26631/g.58950  ORF Transcript_26631/g.58950 Transcript_26631/m.58950 type:complete len:325 (+) Transcript_26631:398-1372(+)